MDPIENIQSLYQRHAKRSAQFYSLLLCTRNCYLNELEKWMLFVNVEFHRKVFNFRIKKKGRTSTKKLFVWWCWIVALTTDSKSEIIVVANNIEWFSFSDSKFQRIKFPLKLYIFLYFSFYRAVFIMWFHGRISINVHG